MKEDFMCSFCKKETIPISERNMDKLLAHKTKFSNLTEKQLVYCKKHNFLLFEKRYFGGWFNQSFEWKFQKKLGYEDLNCWGCVYWNLKNVDVNTEEDWINKICELNLQDEREYKGLSYCVACNKFKLNPKIKKILFKK